MPHLGGRSGGLLLWPALIVLLLAIRAPAGAAQSAGAQKDAARGLGDANRPVAATRKAAWTWTLEERLASRFDPEAMASREAEHKAKVEANRRQQGANPSGEGAAQITEGQPLTETIIGSRTPELFLPTELLDALLSQGFPTANRQPSRNWIESKAAALGFGRDFWDRLEEAASLYLSLRSQQDSGGQVTSASEEKALRLCRQRAQALQAAEAEFGEEAFLRLLYEVVAPDLQVGRMVGPGPADNKEYEETLRFQEGGCQ